MSNLLYYYTSEKNKTRILGSEKLTLAPIGNTNDPFEGMGAALIEMLAYKTKNYDDKYIYEFMEIVKNPKTRYLCMSLNHPRSILGTLMWRRYADAFEGACFVIETEFHLNEIVSKELTPGDWHHGHIKYLSIRDLMKGSFQGKMETIFHGITPFGIKDVEWSHEREYRFVQHNSNEKYPCLCEENFSLKIIGHFEYEKDENKNPINKLNWISKSKYPEPTEPKIEFTLRAGGNHMLINTI